MKKVTKILLGLLLIINPTLFAQDAQMADTMRSEGKIYVVVAIILVIFFGLIGYLIYTDRKISKLEKKLE
ncbi:MAG TPA: CcmD family protein [Cyclobacteriaceae bacterium]|jgi:CcmD family protein|nr:CcmD family protein [Cyclobacteriaceae bacterium]